MRNEKVEDVKFWRLGAHNTCVRTGRMKQTPSRGYSPSNTYDVRIDVLTTRFDVDQ